MLRAEERRQRPVARRGEPIGDVPQGGCRSMRGCRRGRRAGPRSDRGRGRRAAVRFRGARASADYRRARSARFRARGRMRCRAIAARHSASPIRIAAEAVGRLVDADRMSSRSRSRCNTSRAACHGSAACRAPPANTARDDGQQQPAGRLCRIVGHRDRRAEMARVGADDAVARVDVREAAVGRGRLSV